MNQVHSGEAVNLERKMEMVKDNIIISVAGRKLLRDEMWANLRTVHPVDHRYFKRHGLYDFPKRSFRTRFTDALIAFLLRIPQFRNEFRRRLKDEMVKPLAKALEKIPRCQRVERRVRQEHAVD